jgi:hypothetical protein
VKSVVVLPPRALAVRLVVRHVVVANGMTRLERELDRLDVRSFAVRHNAPEVRSVIPPVTPNPSVRACPSSVSSPSSPYLVLNMLLLFAL